MKRKLTQKLIDWKNRPNHKPLILQGARQVGKTYILEEFGREQYKNYIKVSLDLVTDVTNFLKDNINPIEIIAYLESLYNQRILPHETLVASCPTKHWLSWMRFRIVKERSWL